MDEQFPQNTGPEQPAVEFLTPEQMEQARQNLEGLNVSTERSTPELVQEPTPEPVQEHTHTIDHTEADSSQSDERVEDPVFAREMAREEAPLQEMLSRLKQNKNLPDSMRNQSVEDLTEEIRQTERNMEQRREARDRVASEQIKEAVVNIQKYAAEQPAQGQDFEEALKGDKWEDLLDAVVEISSFDAELSAANKDDWDNNPELSNRAIEANKTGVQIETVIKSLVGAKPAKRGGFHLGVDSAESSDISLYETELGTLMVSANYANPYIADSKIRYSGQSISLSPLTPQQLTELYRKANLADFE